MHFKPKINWCIVFIQIRQHREICRKELRKYLLPLTASKLLIEEKMTAAAESDSIREMDIYAHYFQFVRDKDTKNIIVKCTLCAKPKYLSTSLSLPLPNLGFINMLAFCLQLASSTTAPDPQ